MNDIDNNFLFTESIKKESFKPYIRCEDCIYSETREDLEPKYIHCTKYKNMISEKWQTCKASYKRN